MLYKIIDFNYFNAISFGNCEITQNEITIDNDRYRAHVRKNDHSGRLAPSLRITAKRPVSLMTMFSYVYEICEHYGKNYEPFIMQRLRFKGIYRDLLNTKIVQQQKVLQLIGYGGEAVVFEREDNLIFKLAQRSFMYSHYDREQNLNFDVPVLEKGMFEIEDESFYYYVVQKVITEGITEKHVRIVMENILREGYAFSDFLPKMTSQVGLYDYGNGLRPCIIDFSCVRASDDPAGREWLQYLAKKYPAFNSETLRFENGE
ncbi:hypothetical protein ACFL56_03655 [Candidatus Margulisiibacteriota bacterium]